MNVTHGRSALELLVEALEWRMLSLLLSRPTRERKDEVRALASEVTNRRLAAIANDWCLHATEGAYLQLLGPGGLVPARSVAYRAFADPGWILADLAQYHREFGFHSAADEPADHVTVLAEFVAYLLVKEAYARERADAQAATLTRDATTRFIDEHVCPAAGRIAERLDACGATDWSAAAHLLAEKAPAPPSSPSVVAPEDDVAQCGGCPAHWS